MDILHKKQGDSGQMRNIWEKYSGKNIRTDEEYLGKKVDILWEF